jgi:hypothetical protein
MQTLARRVMMVAIPTALMAGCAASGPREYVAPTNLTVQFHSEETYSGDAHVIYVLNRSSAAIVVTNLRLRDCENVKEQCGPMPFHVIVPAGQRVDLLRVTPYNPKLPNSFRYSGAWEPYQGP